MPDRPEAWLRGPIEGVPAGLMPVAHALVQALDEVERAAAGLEAEELWMRPSGVASVGFNLRHIAGVLDRLSTYALGRQLDEAQLAALAAEKEPGEPPPTADLLLRDLRSAVERALDQLRATPPDSLLEPREVGRRKLPSTVQGLLFHAAEHAQRHTGQLIVTAKIVRGAGPD
jgi:uncharacterized damage-inducible protein DinB